MTAGFITKAGEVFFPLQRFLHELLCQVAGNQVTRAHLPQLRLSLRALFHRKGAARVNAAP
jgi:hypothetical protein